MRAVVDPDECIGCGLCADTCPEVFEMGDNVAAATVEEVPEGAEETCREAAESCPVDAITVA